MTAAEALETMRRAPGRNRVLLRGREFAYEAGYVTEQAQGPDFSEPRVRLLYTPDGFLYRFGREHGFRSQV